MPSVTSQTRLAAAVRILTGVIFIAEGWGKVAGKFVRGAFAEDAAKMAEKGWPFWGSFLRSVVLPNAGLFGWLVALGELAIGIALFLGLFTRVAAAGGVALLLAILLGQSYVPGSSWDRWATAGLTTKFSILLMLLLLASDAGRTWGLDAKPWRRGRDSGRRT